jgi:superfamily II DNA or RNA helicase
MSDEISSFLKELAGSKPKPKVYSKKVLTNETKLKLLVYQEDHVVRLINILVEKHIALDSSDTGVGKTYMAIAACREMGRRPIIITPKTIMYNWVTVCNYMGVKPYDVVNYETIKNGKTYVTKEYKENGKTHVSYKFKSRKKSPFLDLLPADPDDPTKCLYDWKLPKDAIVIVDEAHRCKDPSTENGKFLKSMKQIVKKGIPVLLLSATICEKIPDMKIPFYLFEFIPETRNFNHYHASLDAKYPDLKISKRNFFRQPHIQVMGDSQQKLAFKKAKEDMEAIKIHREIKEFTSRIRIKDLGDKFPSNQWCAQLFNSDSSDEIAKAYKELKRKQDELKENPGKHHLADIVKLKQEIERLKIPIFIEQAQEFLDNHKSVIIFVNYLNTLHEISESLDIRCKIYGDQTLEERQESIDLFQSNQERIIICQMRAGSVGISLHDIHGRRENDPPGTHERVTLINYPDTATDLIQAMGRACRSGGKSPVLQRIVLVANVDYETKIKKNIDRKLTNVSAINDADLDGYKYKIIKKKIQVEAVANPKKKKVDADDDILEL